MKGFFQLVLFGSPGPVYHSGVFPFDVVVAHPGMFYRGDLFSNLIRQLVTFLTLCDFFVHAYELTVPILVFLLFALKKATAAGQNVGNHYCHLSWYHKKVYPA